MEQRFNSYLRIWLDHDAVRGILDVDFNITLEENEKIHVAEGYSVGYCDLVDFCMRLALVDTLFEREQPFLILDDPFVNLDENRLKKALRFLNELPADKQIVYFVCHPICAGETSENSETRAEFARLTQAAKEAIEKRKTDKAERKHNVRRYPRELYHVVNPGAALAVKPV